MSIKKYKTDEERKAANREKDKCWREKNPEKAKAKRERYKERHPDRVRANDIAQNSKREDRKYGRGECTITPEWIMKNIFTSKCFYCGATGWENLGCDRINNDLPHTPENVVPCCTRCNRKRRGMPFKDFVKLVKECGNISDVPSQHYESKPVVACNPETMEIIYEFASTGEAGKNGFCQGAVSAACRGCLNRDGNHQYRGLLWFYKE